MKVLVTGATGFVGRSLCGRLVERGDTVRALCRSPAKAQPLVDLGVSVCAGSLEEGLDEAMVGCEAVFHLAALAAAWSADPGAFYRVNVQGTRRVLDAASAAGVGRVVHASTAAVLGPAVTDAPVDEDTVRVTPWFSPYEETKAQAEQLVRDRVHAGFDAVIASPTRVYGPTTLRPLPPMDRLVRSYLTGAWRWLPGDGRACGNYVHVDDVADGLIQVLDGGKAGERYLLGGENASFADVFGVLGRVSDRPRRLLAVPRPLMMGVAQVATGLAGITGHGPLLTPGWVHRFLLDWRMSSGKAMQALDYRPRGLEAGLAQTVAWLRAVGQA